ncbi:MAG: BON domain-containing protein [Verrucomicrobia bacterium]|nr:BON domain-containing protein [Verrucomicrobiota bacterium]
MELWNLESDPKIGSDGYIAVATKHGVVTLTGFVSSFWEKDAAEKDAILVHAVKGVANDIEVRPFWQPTDPDIAPVFTVDADFVLVTAAIPGVVTELEHRGLRIAWHPFTVNAQKSGSDLTNDPVFDRRMLSGFSGWSGASRSAIAGTFARQACVKLDGKKRYGRANRNWNSAIS